VRLMDPYGWPGRDPGRHDLGCAMAGRQQWTCAALLVAGTLVMLAVLLIAAPEVPLDLALVAMAGALLFTAAAEVVRVTAR
jgi:hypothetical protein